MPRRSINVDDVLFDYLMDQSIREHPAQVALRAATAPHPFAGMQIGPDQGQFMALLVKLMGARRAAEKLLLGDPFTGADAVECGIANAVLPAAEVVNHARRVAERFNTLPPGAVRDSKRLMRGPQREPAARRKGLTCREER